MRTLKQALVLMVAGGMLTPSLPAQSIWQRMKQSAQQVERNAEAQQHRTQPTSASASSAQSSQPAAVRNISNPAATAPANADSLALKALNRKLEVGGVWLDMPAGAAQAAILKRNPKLTANPHHFGFAETPNTLYTDTIGFQQQTMYSYAQSEEAVGLGLVLQPMPSAVASITRRVTYDEKSAPTVAATIQALLAKYGPASMVLPKDATDDTKYLWIFDGSGKLLKPTNPYAYPAACAQTGTGTVLPILRTNPADLKCTTYTTLAAEVYEWNPKRTLHNGQTMPPGVLFQLTVTATSYPLLNESANATRNMLIAARNGEQQQKKNALKKNAPVL